LQKIVVPKSAKYPSKVRWDECLKMWSNVAALPPRVLDVLASKTPTKKFEQQTSNQCHRFEYLTLLNTSLDATTRDYDGIDEYNVREVVDAIPPKER